MSWQKRVRREIPELGKQGFASQIIIISNMIISQILSRANDLLSYISYAAGYATGNYVGIIIESRIAFGVLVCRIYTNKEPSSLVRMIKNRGYGVTVMEGMGSIMKAWVVEAVVERKALKEIDQYITNFDKNTFYTAEDVRIRQKGIFPEPTSFFNRWRPGKYNCKKHLSSVIKPLQTLCWSTFQQ